MARSIGNIVEGLKPAMMMVVVQITYAGVNVFYKLAANDGMSLKVLVAYRLIFAAAVTVPLGLVLERKNRPKLTWVVLIQSFFCGLFAGPLAQNLYLETVVLTSTTFAAASGNLIPALTFILAICFGLEKMQLGTVSGRAKVAGTILGISGAMILTFYKGAEINIWSTNVHLLHRNQGHIASQHADAAKRVLGSLMGVGSAFSYALWLIVQARMSVDYPCYYSSTSLMNVMAAIQATVFALCAERDFSQWKLGWNIRLLTAVYSGIVASGVSITLIAWCIRTSGPLFISIFSPLCLVLVALLGSLILDEKLHVGSVLGSALIVVGLYVVLWGKGREMKRMGQLAPSKSSNECQTIEVVSTYSDDGNSNSNNTSTRITTPS